MTPDTIDEIIACLPHGRTPFAYFRDRYALELVAAACRHQPSVAALKRSPVAPLLEKPVVKRQLAGAGDGRQAPARLRAGWPDEVLGFHLSLDRWAGGRRDPWNRWWVQTSRPGANLVLQLNLGPDHDAAFERLVGPEHHGLLRGTHHPVHPRCKTLAWARLDVDLDAGAALIEEIQSDWVRDLRWAERFLHDCAQRGRCEARLEGQHLRGGHAGLRRYCREVLAPYAAVWDEAMLFAALWFLQVELGIREIWYHSFASGNLLKHLAGDLPPRSLYERLPRRFCFRTTEAKPDFLVRDLGRTRRKRLDAVSFYRCSVENLAA